MKMIDLSHVQEADMPIDPALKLPTLDFFSQLEKGDSYNLENISYTPHSGTHIDAPYHVLADGKSVKDIEPTVLIGQASVISLDVSGNYVISLNDLKNWEKENGVIEKGDGVLFDTKQDELWEKGKEAYIDGGYPTLSIEAAKYLVSRQIDYIGMESISPDGPSPNAHKILLENNIMVVENLRNLSEIGQARCYTIGTIPAVDGGTGSWVRLLAFVK